MSDGKAGMREENIERVPQVYFAASASRVGSRTLLAEEVDRAFGMPVGKLRGRAGIVSLAYATQDENELTLGAEAAASALRAAGCVAGELDWIVATSETHHDYPSLAAQLHTKLLVRESCGVLDVGGACLGLLNAFAVAQSLIGSGQARAVLVVTGPMETTGMPATEIAPAAATKFCTVEELVNVM